MICRMCGLGEEAKPGRLLKYGVRHYGHGACLLRKFGVRTFEMLPFTELRRFPASAADEAGLFPALMAAYAKGKRSNGEKVGV